VTAKSPKRIKPTKRTKRLRKRNPAATMPAIPKKPQEPYFCRDVRQMFLPLWQVRPKGRA